MHSSRPVVPLRSAQKFTYGGYNLTSRLILARSAGCLGVPHLLRGACALTGDSMHKTTTKGTSAAQRRLECLRDDCRLHEAPATRLIESEQAVKDRAFHPEVRVTIAAPQDDDGCGVRFAPQGVARGKLAPRIDLIGGDIGKAEAFLDRFGALLEESRADQASEWRDGRRIAINALLAKVRPKACLEVCEGDAPALRLHERRVPDVRLAIAEAIDAMLVPAEGRKRRTKVEVAQRIEEKALLAAGAISKKPEASNRDIASAIGEAEAWYSRHLSNHPIVAAARKMAVTKEFVSEALAQGLKQFPPRRKACK